MKNIFLNFLSILSRSKATHKTAGSSLVFLTLVFSLFIPSSYAEQNKNVLRWGSDANSGAPFVFRDPANPNQIIGSDADIAEAIAEELGLKSEFVQNTWEGLIPGLNAKNYDVVLDGLEIVNERKQSIAFSMPYYVTYEQIVVRKDNHTIKKLSDLVGKKVGTLPASLAQKVLKGLSDVNIKYYPEEVNAFNDLATGNRIDAVVIDDVIAKYYAAPNPNLKLLNIPIGKMLYGVGIRKDGTLLQEKINVAISHLIENGKLKLILEKWGLWNRSTAEIFGLNPIPATPPVAYEAYLKSIQVETNFKDKVLQYASFVPLLAKGAVTTLEISILSMILAMTLGLLIAIVRLYAPKMFAALAVLYIEMIRGTPLLIQLYLIFYGLPLLGLRLSPFISAVVGLGLNYAASEAENYRAGILSVPKHQMDAAFALGMTRVKALKHIIIPQALRLVIPPMTNDFIALIKDSSLVSVITLVELTTVYSQLATTYFDYLGIGILAAFMYFLIGLPFARLSRAAEKKFTFYLGHKKTRT